MNGPYEVYTAVRQRYKDGADGIKITVTGGVLTPRSQAITHNLPKKKLMLLSARQKIMECG